MLSSLQSIFICINDNWNIIMERDLNIDQRNADLEHFSCFQCYRKVSTASMNFVTISYFKYLLFAAYSCDASAIVRSLFHLDANFHVNCENMSYGVKRISIYSAAREQLAFHSIFPPSIFRMTNSVDAQISVENVPSCVQRVKRSRVLVVILVCIVMFTDSLLLTLVGESLRNPQFLEG